MCGIIGYIGNKEAAPILLTGLRRLEYRGYDSCGVACASADSKIYVKKGIGTVEEVHSRQNFNNINGRAGIAHTRWATHGGVTVSNTHPILSNNFKIAVVHNGIIDNYMELRNFLGSNGFVFNTETDTEVIPNLIEYYMQRGYDFVEATKSTIRQLKGQYAVIVLSSEGEIVAVRKEAPLVVGIGKEEYFIASDVTAFLESTRDVIFLEENDFVTCTAKTGLQIYSLDKNIFVSKKISKIEWDAEQVKKGNFDHYFIKEIVEQAEVIKRLCVIEHQTIKDLADEIKQARGVYIVACGTSSYASMLAVYLFSKIANMHINFCVASEFKYFHHFLTENSLIIAISQSGESADTLEAIRTAKKHGAKVLAITNTNSSSLYRESDKSILQRAGAEIAVNSTKAYTSQLAILCLLAYELGGLFEEGRAKLKELIKVVFYLTSENARKYVKKLAVILKDKEHLYLIGRGLQYPTALEAAHKIKEAAYIHAEAFAGGELKHGSNALVVQGTPYIVFISDETETDIINNAMEVKARGAFIIGIGAKRNPVFDFHLKVYEAGDFNPIVQIIPMQILAYELALLRGCDPDRPRNLAKCVTVR